MHLSFNRETMRNVNYSSRIRFWYLQGEIPVWSRYGLKPKPTPHSYPRLESRGNYVNYNIDSPLEFRWVYRWLQEQTVRLRSPHRSCNGSPVFELCINGSLESQGNYKFTPGQTSISSYEINPLTSHNSQLTTHTFFTWLLSCSTWLSVSRSKHHFSLNHPPLNPAFFNPATIYGFFFITFQISSDWWFSIMRSMGPWSMPR